MKKISEWLQEIKDPEVRKKALANFKAQLHAGRVEDLSETKLSMALQMAFWWHDTPEGRKYWDNVGYNIYLEEKKNGQDII